MKSIPKHIHFVVAEQKYISGLKDEVEDQDYKWGIKNKLKAISGYFEKNTT